MIRAFTALTAATLTTVLCTHSAFAKEGAPPQAENPEVQETTPPDSDALRALHRDAVQQSVDALLASFEARDYDAMIAGVPPALLRVTAADLGVDVDTARAQMRRTAEQGLASITFEEYRVDVDAATFGATSTGRHYALIPTSTTVTHDGRRIRTTDTTLAFINDGVWYLVRVSGPDYVATLQSAYPDFAGLQVPQGGTVLLP